MIRDEYKSANIFNNFFINIVPNLGIKVDQQYFCNTSNLSDIVEKAIKYAKNILVSLLLKNGINCRQGSCLFFHIYDFRWSVERNSKSWFKKGNLRVKKSVSKSHCRLFEKKFNCCYTEGTFPNDLKKAVVDTTHKARLW